MGSQAMQGKLWGQRHGDWALIQEQTGLPGYEFVLKKFSPIAGHTLLDIGCGSGYFSKLAHDKGALVTGIDASTELIGEAKKRIQGVNFMTGEMEELPFGDQSFDLVCGFNSFQYAADIRHALSEAKRVLKKDGRLAVMIWGNREDCEAAGYLKAVGGLMPPPPPGAPGPFALSENQLLETILKETGFTDIHSNDIDAVWDYPDAATALKGLVSAGPVSRAIENSGLEKVNETVTESMKPFVQEDGRVVYRNKFRVVSGVGSH